MKLDKRWRAAKSKLPKEEIINQLRSALVKLMVYDTKTMGGPPRGEKNGMSKLKEKRIPKIFILYHENKFSMRYIAEFEKVHVSSIKKVLSAQTWKYLTAELHKKYAEKFLKKN